MSSALKIARRYKNINSIGLHFERTHISVVVKAGCNLKTRMPARNGVSLTLCCFVVYFTRRFVLSLALCYFVLLFFNPFSIAILRLPR